MCRQICIIVALSALSVSSPATSPGASVDELPRSYAGESRGSLVDESRRSLVDESQRSLVGEAWQATTSVAAARSGDESAERQVMRLSGAHPIPGSAPDTLWNRIRGGDILIVALPVELQRRHVERYSIVRAPALSWLVDRSFMWRTLPDDEGRHEVLIRADFDPASSDSLLDPAPSDTLSDTLVVSISVD